MREDEEPKNPLLDRVSVDPHVCFGKPVIRGTRIWVTQLLDYLAGGMTMPELLTEYPQLEPADVLAAIAYGSTMIREAYHY